MKFIFVTWWVISGLWKWIAASSIWRLLKSAWFKVSIAKMDPYLQIDAWTMSPYEHWEVFVTNDWWETDLDLWHYERFIDEDLSKKNSITTWQVYLSVIQKERKWEFLWKTVQVIPHITNEIKDRLYKLSEKLDVLIVEIWWTIWDIEWLHFVETIRQIKQELWNNNVVSVHVAPILKVTTSWELKTKAIQHSVIRLRELWIYTDILIIRTNRIISDDIKKKLSLFCWLPTDSIIEWIDQNIYQVPTSFKKQNLDSLLIKKLFWKENIYSDLSQRNWLVDRMLNPKKTINIAISGKYTKLEDSYLSIIEALNHAWTFFECKVNIHRLDTENFELDNSEKKIEQYIQENNIKWVLTPWWFWNRWIEGMINVANYCRKNNIPYLWICLWLQIATISFARSVCNFKNANSTEFDKNTPYPVIDFLENQRNVKKIWWTMRLWEYPAMLKEWSQILNLYKKYWEKINTERWNLIKEKHRHRYEVNPNFHWILEKKWLVISWKSPDWDLAEFIEFPKNDFYIATQAHPELKSRINRPHPLFLWFIESSLD